MILIIALVLFDKPESSDSLVFECKDGEWKTEDNKCVEYTDLEKRIEKWMDQKKKK